MQGWQVLNENIEGFHSYLIEYYKIIKSGEKVVGQELTTALDRYIDEMHAPEFRYTGGGLKKAHKRIDFIETKLKHFEAPFAGKPFLLTIEQKAIAETLFAFEYFDPEYNEWVRRFQDVLLLIGRKNGKTPYIGALVLAEWFCGEMGQKVMCASNDYEQASIIFDCINNFREESRTIEHVTRKNNTGIYFGNRKQRRTVGKFSKQNKGSIKKMSAKTGAKEGRNLKIVVADEVHEMKDDSTILPLRSSLSTQKEPLYIEITTEGIVNDGYLDKRLEEARKVLRGEAAAPRWLVWLYTQDSEAEVWRDEASWTKSNPLLGVSKKWSYLRGLVDEARTSGSKRAFTLAKEFNIKSSRPTAAWDDAIIINTADFTLDDFRGCWCIAGADLSEVNDLSAVALLLMRPGDPVKYFHTMYFVPETKAGDPMSTESAATNPEKKNYIEWRDEGYCRIVPGNIIDDNVVADYLVEIWKTYGIRTYRAGFDEWHATEFKKRTAKTFGEQVPVKIKMSPSALDAATKAVENDLRAKHLNYQNNPICVWNFRNVAMKYDSEGHCMPTKIKGFVGNKIDGAMAKVIAYAALRQVKTAFMQKVG